MSYAKSILGRSAEVLLGIPLAAILLYRCKGPPHAQAATAAPPPRSCACVAALVWFGARSEANWRGMAAYTRICNGRLFW